YLTNGWELTARPQTPPHHQSSPQRLGPSPFTANARSLPSVLGCWRLAAPPPVSARGLDLCFLPRVVVVRHHCTQPNASFARENRPCPPSLLASAASVLPRLPPPVSARALRGCCCSSSVGVAACTARFCLCNNSQQVG
ncbi:hypothetical protein S245_004644, partial [Arachis hypogaea]